MRWIHRYDLFLFDLDGLLVNTEELHYKAYMRTCFNRGFVLPWTFSEYFRIVSQDSEGPKKGIYAALPELEKQEGNWAVLYREKGEIYRELLESEVAPLMPGAAMLLSALKQEGKCCAVVTHSEKDFVQTLQKKNPLLAETIKHWFTREDYALPKPSPDGYLAAIKKLAKEGDAIIGFEDSPRGLQALLASPVTAVLINGLDDGLRERSARLGARTFRSLEELSLADSAL